MMAEKELETWPDYGKWYPTAELRWGQHGKLEQVWRRNFETRWGGGVVMGGNGFQAEWRDVPQFDAPGQA